MTNQSTEPSAIEATVAEALAAERADMPTTLHFFDRPGGPPGNYERPMTAKEARDTIAMLEAEVAKLSAPVDDDALVKPASRAVHEHLSRRDIMQYLDIAEDCEGLARAVVAAIAAGKGEQ